MKEYYDQRAPEYDDWYLGRGLFEPRDREGWDAELDQLFAVIAPSAPGRTLDVACGTGFLTRHLRGDVVGLDQSERMLDEAHKRGAERHVSCRATGWRCRSSTSPSTACSPGTSTATSDRPSASASSPRRAASRRSSWSSMRRARTARSTSTCRSASLNDGSTWEVFKRYFTGAGLAAELGGGEVLHDGDWFVVVRA